MLFPSEARAELIDIANTPGIVIKDYAYPANSTGVTEGTSLYNDIRASLICNPYTTSHTGPTDYSTVVPFQHVLRETVPTHAITSASEASHTNLGYEMMRSNAAWTIPTKQAILAYVSFDMYENPLPAGSRLTFDGFQAPFITNSTEYDNKGAWDYNGGMGTADRVYVWYSNSRQANTAKLASYDSTLGFYEIPETARYVYITFRLRWSNTPTASEKQYRIYYENRMHMYWQVIGNDTISTNQTIDNQTQTLMDTTGGDAVTGTTVTNFTQQVNQIPVVSLIDTFTQQVQNEVNTQEVDGTVTFPGMSLAGFVVPQVTIRPMSLVSNEMQTMIRMMVTFIFVQAFLRHLFHLIDVIFVIQDFGTLDVGMDSYDRGPKVKNWSSDYGLDEDLGF